MKNLTKKQIETMVSNADETIKSMTSLGKELNNKEKISDAIIEHFKATEFGTGQNFNALTVTINHYLEIFEGDELADLKNAIRKVFQPNLASAKVQKELFSADIEKQKTHKIAMKKVNKEMLIEFDESLLGQYVVVIESKNKGGNGGSDSDGSDNGDSDEPVNVSEPTFNELRDAKIKQVMAQFNMTTADMRVWCDNNPDV
jgi:hypothetical protein